MAPLDQDRSKRLGKILENANRYEDSKLRRSRFASFLWALLAVLIVIGMFYAGRAWYSQPEFSKKPEIPRSSQHAIPSEKIAETRVESKQAPTPAMRSEKIDDRRLLAGQSSPAPTQAVEESREPSLPEEVELTAPAELHILREGKIVGVIYLKSGDKVKPTKRDGGKLMVRWKEAEGTVLVSQTTLAHGD